MKYKYLQQLLDKHDKSDKWFRIGGKFVHCVTAVVNGVTRRFVDGVEQTDTPRPKTGDRR